MQLERLQAAARAGLEADNARLRTQLAAQLPPLPAAPAESATLQALTDRVGELLGEKRALEEELRALEARSASSLAAADQQLDAAAAREASLSQERAVLEERLAEQEHAARAEARGAAARAAAALNAARTHAEAQLGALRVELAAALACLQQEREERAAVAEQKRALELGRQAAAEQHRAELAEQRARLSAPGSAARAVGSPARAELREAQRQAEEANEMVAHLKELYVQKAADNERIKEALAQAHEQLRAAREAAASSEASGRARPSSSGMRYVRIELGGGDNGADASGGGSAKRSPRPPMELRLHMTGERAAQSERVVERIRSFLKDEVAGGLSARELSTLRRRTASPRGRGAAQPLVQPPMRI